MANLEHTRGQRLDQKVVELLPELSRAFASKLIDEGKVKVNGVVQTKAGVKLRAGDSIDVDYDDAEQQAIPDIELPIVFEDDDCVVIIKSVGLLTHSKGAFNPEPTVATWLFRHCAAKGAPLEGEVNARAGIVHRLDRATSGIMICAKNTTALMHLQKQFSQRKTKKTYYAVVRGMPKHEAAVIDMPIERNPKAPATFRVGNQGKPAKTTYKIEAADGDYSLLKLTPETGRTHQLRVHLLQLGHPIVGDTMYGGEPADRLFLHAAELEVTIPKGSERKVFSAEVPKEFWSWVR
ncbi:MAG: Pseudouridine synthase [Patescibacteria group bacterium]|nr:RluA family pseudouridine synthase [Candidatus Saccharibacteria bacterium]MDQ5963467.1 Pseudouridine synthase [Patescibacteria group bacterium]